MLRVREPAGPVFPADIFNEQSRNAGRRPDGTTETTF